MNESQLIKYISDGVDRAKAGEALGLYEELAEYADKGAIPARSHYAFGWICYYALHQSPDRDIASRNRILARYLALDVPRPHKLHSMILTEAVRLARDVEQAAYGKGREAPTFSFTAFLRLWGPENLRPGDWRRKELDDKKLSSLAEKAATICTGEAQDSGAEPDGAVVALVDEALAKFPDSYNLLSQRATLHILAGERAEASQMLRQALLEAPGKFFLWAKLAGTIPVEENPNLHIALLYKALTAPGPEQYKGRIRLSLAQALAARGKMGEARHELQRMQAVYEANGWHLPPAAQRLKQSLPADIAGVDPGAAYKKVEPLAVAYIYESLPQIAARKSYHKLPAEGQRYGRPAVAWRVTDAEGHNYWLTPSRHGIQPDLPMGTAVLIRLHGGKVVDARVG